MKIIEQLRCLFLDNRPFRKALEVKGRRIILSVGYGVLADANVSIRLTAYLLPSIYLANYLLSQGNDVCLRIYFAEHAAPIVLGRSVDMAKVRQWVQSASSLLNWFLDCFSEVERFSIATDRVWEGRLAETIERLARISWPKEILKRVERYPCPKDSMRYLAAHALYMLDPLDIPFCPILKSEDDSLEGNLVIVVGGPQERLTSEVRDRLRRQLGMHKLWENWTLETPIGNCRLIIAGSRISIGRILEIMIFKRSGISRDNLIRTPLLIFNTWQPTALVASLRVARPKKYLFLGWKNCEIVRIFGQS